VAIRPELTVIFSREDFADWIRPPGASPGDPKIGATATLERRAREWNGIRAHGPIRGKTG